MTSSNEDLDWIKSACAPDVYRQQPYIEAAESVRWAPLESLMEDTFGPRKVQELGWRHNTELLTRDTAATDDYAGIKSAHTTESGIPVSNEDIRPDPSTEKFEQLRLTEAMSLMREGAGAPSCHIGHEEDITDTPAPMTGFEGAITLWPHQLAGVSRLQRLLKSHLCALLAFEMGLGKTFVVIGLLINMGLTTRNRDGPILIVLPKGLLKQWEEDLRTKIRPAPSVCVYHDGKFTTTEHSVRDLEQYDIVLTTYNIIRIQYERMISTQERFLKWLSKKLPLGFPNRTHFPMFAITWWFVILDEAHRVANPETNISVAVRELPGKYRLPITGTPLQNDYTDVQGLLAFMHVNPWSDLEYFRQHFIQKKQRKKNRGDILNTQLTAVLAATMKAVSLRLRISDKFDGEPVAKFTPASEWQVEHPLNRNQRDTQQITKHIWDTQTRRDLEEARKRPGYRGPLSQKETFPAIMAARLSPVHEACPFAGYGEAGDMDLVDGPGGLQEDTLENMLLRIEDGDGLSRGYQGKNIKKSKERRSEFRGKMKTEWQSFRMTKMLEVISRQKQKGKRGKYLIFSDFLCVLDVAHAALDACGYKALRFDGWATTTEKETALQLFQDPTDGHEFLLVTNRSGGEGINLQEATTVIHLTPSWNPAMTRQCNSRAVRSGQKRNVDVFYFCIMDSIEGYIYRLAQEKDTKASELLDPTDQTLEVVSQSLEWDRKYFTNIMSAAKMSAKEYRKALEVRKLRLAETKKAKEEEHKAKAFATVSQDFGDTLLHGGYVSTYRPDRRVDQSQGSQKVAHTGINDEDTSSEASSESDEDQEEEDEVEQLAFGPIDEDEHIEHHARKWGDGDDDEAMSDLV